MGNQVSYDGECRACDYKTKVQDYSHHKWGEPVPIKVPLCFFCATTFLGNVHLYPDQQGPGIANLARSIGWLANWFADQLQLERTP